jgi:hypothetical protein
VLLNGAMSIQAPAPTAATAELFASLAAYQPGPDLGAEMESLAHFQDLVSLTVATLAGQLAESPVPAMEGYASPVGWLRQETRMATGVAADRVAVGLNLERLPASRAALERGEIGFAHLALMAHMADDIRHGVFAEEPLLARAKRETVTRFRHTCEHVRHAQDPAGFAETEEERYQQRFLELSQQDDGSVWLRGWLPPEGGSLLRSALDPLAKPGGDDDHRDQGQRLADALIEAVTKDQQTELVVTCSLETLEGRLGAPAAETEWGGILSGRAIERLSCTAALRRLVLDSESVVIDLGRKSRLLSPQGRRALIARDRTCVVPGCEKPPRWCEPHHKEMWAEGGGTAVNKSALLCGWHHRLVHEGGWRLLRLAEEGGGWKMIPPTPPDWRTLVATHRPARAPGPQQRARAGQRPASRAPDP